MFCFVRTRDVLTLITLLAGSSLWSVADDAPVVPLNIQFSTKNSEIVMETDAPLKTDVTLTNTTHKDVSSDIDYLIQQEPLLYSEAPPDPIYGIDVAHGAHSWAEANGHQAIESNDQWGRSNCTVNGSNFMTDGKTWTHFGTGWDECTEAFGFIDLGKTYNVVRMVYDAADPPKGRKLDFSSSLDGKDYTPIDGLQGINIQDKQGSIEIIPPKPFEARYIRFRQQNDGGEKVHAYRFPSEFHVYAGMTDSTWTFPKVGVSIAQDKLTQSVPSGGSSKITLGDGKPLKPGAYLVAVRTKTDGVTQMAYGHILVMPPALPAISPTSRFGIGANDAGALPMLVREGIGSIHYTNLLWPTVSPSPDTYKFTEQDKALKAFHDAGLPVMAQLSEILRAVEFVEYKNGELSPPKDFDKYGEYVFQTVARYGSKKQSDSDLLTSDKVSGLGYIDTYEIWNNPNPNNLGLGEWKAPLNDYYKLFRIGAEAVKKADPAAKVANGGWWGLDYPLIDTMRTFKYDDGKTPLDFTDVLNINYYSPLGDIGSSYGTEPEVSSTYDISHHHENVPFDRFIDDDLRTLVAWRDKNKPGMPIWFTKTGFDCGMNERLETAWLPRGLMVELAAGVDKVMLPRDRQNAGERMAPGGVMHDDGTLKPSWFTYATLIRQLDGVTGGAMRIPTDDDNVRVYLWKRGDKPVLTAWTIKYTPLGGVTGKLNMALGKCTLTDAFGYSQSVDIQQSQPLTEFPIYITDLEPAVAQKLDAQAKAFADKQQQETERLSKLKAYFFKFGRGENTRVKENDAMYLLGTMRDFTLVSGSEVYDDAKGYGFTSPSADEQQIWFQNPLTIGITHFDDKAAFKFKAEPGTYKLSFAPRLGEHATISGIEGGDKQLTYGGPGTVSAGIINTTVKVGDKPVSISLPNGAIVWLTMIPTADTDDTK